MPHRHLTNRIGTTLLLGAIFLLGGCRQRTLTWQSRPDLALPPATVLAVVDPQLSPDEGPGGQVSSSTANDIAAAFMQRGYRVKFLTRLIRTPPLQAEGIDIDPQVASDVPEPAPPGDLLAKARILSADLLVEVILQAVPRMTVEPLYGPPYGRFGVYMGSGGYYGAWDRSYPWSGPRYAREYDVRYSLEVQAASLRITGVRSADVLATITVRYDVLEDDPADIAADLMMGVDAIRQGQHRGSVELETRPGRWPDDHPLSPSPADTDQTP